MRNAPPFAITIGIAAALAVSVGTALSSSGPNGSHLPPVPQREFRAAWVATVDNIDWPSKRGLPVEQQQAEIIRILDRAVEVKLNAIVLQVRPSCDAFYPSKLEPWSEYLTGKQGLAPDPFYDPLAMWVKEAHRRGIELHAWFNPYRARHPSAKQPVCSDHLRYKNPKIVREYGKHLWLDPGEPETQEHSLRVILDAVRRYDLDGVHMDDYFYPYKEKDASGNIIDFPDDPSWARYVKQNSGSAPIDRSEWRRANVDNFIERLYRELKKAKRHVKFGISPFGIWRPGNPPQIQGFDQYSQLYADARKWIREGWCDYWTPQLYWPISQRAQSYPVLLKWWVEQNQQARHIWPGNYTSRVGETWKADELVNQIKVTRKQEGAGGNVHFSMKAILENRGGLAELLKSDVYSQPALVPASPWLANQPPQAPNVKLSRDTAGAVQVILKPNGSEPWLWLVQTKSASGWRDAIVPGSSGAYSLEPIRSTAEVVAVSAVDRCGQQSSPTVLDLSLR